MNATLGDLSGRRVVAIASFDSFIKTARIMLDACEEAGALSALIVAELPRRRPTQEQIQKAGVRTQPVFVPVHKVAGHPLVASADALLLLLDGRRTRLLMRSLFAKTFPPVIVSAFPGLIFRSHVGSFMDRAPADLLCLNSEADRALYSEAGSTVGVETGNAVVTGLPLLWDMQPSAGRPDGPVVFFEQPAIPDNEPQREFLADKLLEFAKSHPDIQVILKGRNRADEPTLHRSRGPLESIIARKGDVPANLTVSYASTDEALKHARVAATISSTAALESLAKGVPTRIIADLGITEQLGNHFFIGSGLFSTFEALLDPLPPVPDNWLEQSAKPADGKSRFITALSRNITSQRHPRQVNHAENIYRLAGHPQESAINRVVRKLHAFVSRFYF